jgi:hypothetical protein
MTPRAESVAAKRAIARAASAVLGALLVACGAGGPGGATGNSGTGTGTTGSTTSGTTGSTTGFATAAHGPLPDLVSQGGPTLSPLDVVTISYADVQLDLDGYVDALLASDWFSEVGTEYGIQAGAHLASYTVPSTAPTAISDPQIQSFLAGLIESNAVPAPTSTTVYALEYPPETTVAASSTRTICQQIIGYHGVEPTTGAIYAVIGNCPLSLDTSLGFPTTEACGQFYTSHELFESATDPTFASAPAYMFSTTPANVPYLATDNSELADLCITTPPVTVDAGLIATRIWSNAAAETGRDPCVPTPAGEIYYTVSAAVLGDAGAPGAPNVAFATSGLGTSQTFQFLLTGWSTGPMADWNFFTATTASFSASITVSDTDGGYTPINNGLTQTVTVTVPPGIGEGNYVGVGVYSQAAPPNSNLAALAVYVGE